MDSQWLVRKENGFDYMDDLTRLTLWKTLYKVKFPWINSNNHTQLSLWKDLCSVDEGFMEWHVTYILERDVKRERDVKKIIRRMKKER